MAVGLLSQTYWESQHVQVWVRRQCVVCVAKKLATNITTNQTCNTIQDRTGTCCVTFIYLSSVIIMKAFWFTLLSRLPLTLFRGPPNPCGSVSPRNRDNTKNNKKWSCLGCVNNFISKVKLRDQYRWWMVRETVAVAAARLYDLIVEISRLFWDVWPTKSHFGSSSFAIMRDFNGGWSGNHNSEKSFPSQPEMTLD